MQITNHMAGSVCIVSIKGELEWDGINDVRQYVVDCLEGTALDSILLDCADITGLDSKGGVLVTTLYQTLVEEGTPLALCNVTSADQEGLKKFNLDQMVQIFDTVEEALVHLRTLSNEQEDTAEDSKVDYHPVLLPAVQYFQELEQKSLKGGSNPKGLLEAKDGCAFDEESVEEALIMCEQLQIFLSDLSQEQLHLLQVIYPFYKSPDRLLDKLKITFMGDLKVKEKIIRIYATKAFGSYKITTNILTCPALFEGVEAKTAKAIKQTLLNYSQGTFKSIKELLPVTVRAKMKWTPKTLVPNIKKFLTQNVAFFNEQSDYPQVAQKFRAIIYNIFASPHMELYLTWKNNYLKHWLFEDLYQEDVSFIERSNKKISRFMPLKVKIYQTLPAVFATLEAEDQVFDKSILLRKTELSVLSRGDAFGEDVDDTLAGYFTKARNSEKALLDSLSINQVATVAEWVHKAIQELKKNQKEGEEELPALNTRHTDIASEQKAEQAYTAKTIEVQIENSERIVGKKGKFLGALKQLKDRFKFGRKTAAKPEEPEVEPESTIPGRTPGITQPLPMVDVDWVGYGREFKSTIYEHKVPNLQKFFFDHGELKIYLFLDFKDCVRTLMDYYNADGQVQKNIHKVGVTVDGRNVIKTFEDEALYLKTGSDTVLALGRAPFSKTSEATTYFQVYRSKGVKPYQGTTKNIDFSKTFDGTKYQMENFEKAPRLRPILFRHLIHAIDSLPDNLRDKHEDLLKGLHNFLNNQSPAEENNRRNP